MPAIKCSEPETTKQQFPARELYQPARCRLSESQPRFLFSTLSRDAFQRKQASVGSGVVTLVVCKSDWVLIAQTQNFPISSCQRRNKRAEVDVFADEPD
ncbi:MAG: hypothetical protein JWM11_885 [Planctomycetaceae bacterium]|nr:hypothetical protein [Planctomycetaceae bacterium]